MRRQHLRQAIGHGFPLSGIRAPSINASRADRFQCPWNQFCDGALTMAVQAEQEATGPGRQYSRWVSRMAIAGTNDVNNDDKDMKASMPPPRTRGRTGRARRQGGLDRPPVAPRLRRRAERAATRRHHVAAGADRRAARGSEHARRQGQGRERQDCRDRRIGPTVRLVLPVRLRTPRRHA